MHVLAGKLQLKSKKNAKKRGKVPTLRNTTFLLRKQASKGTKLGHRLPLNTTYLLCEVKYCLMIKYKAYY